MRIDEIQMFEEIVFDFGFGFLKVDVKMYKKAMLAKRKRKYT